MSQEFENLMEEMSLDSLICDCVSEIITQEGAITLTVDGFGIVRDPITNNQEVVKRYTWTNKNRMSVQVITYGATITSIKVPNKKGFAEDVVMGFDDIEGYTSDQNPYFGCTVGRVCNRIKDARFCLDGQVIKLAKNWNNKHHLHGGVNGFNKYNWVPYTKGTTLTLTHTSPDLDEGYPGTLMVRATFNLTHDNNFHIKYFATTSKPTPINITNHSYFNLAGHGAGYSQLYKHIVTLNADKYTETDEDSIPTGILQCVGGTIYDFRVPHELGPALSRVTRRGYDDNFIITKGTEQELSFVTRVLHPNSGRVLEILSNQPGVQFYTGNFLPDPFEDIHPDEVITQEFFELPETTKVESVTYAKCYEQCGDLCNKELCSSSNTESVIKSNELVCEGAGEGAGEQEAETMLETNECSCVSSSCDCTATTLSCVCSDMDEPIIGKGGANYLKHGAFCMETQKFPDAVNQKYFPSTILRPGETYNHEIIYKFGIHIGINPVEVVFDPCEFINEEEGEAEEIK